MVMSALRKPVSSRAKQDKVVLVPMSAFGREALRKQTNYQTGAGWFIVYNAVLADLPFLTRSTTFTSLILLILRFAQGRDSSRPTETQGLPDAGVAEACNCDIRELQRNYDYGTRAGLFTRKKVGQGHSVLSLRLVEWAKLPDYKDWLKSNIQLVEEPEVTEDTGEREAKDATHVRLLKAPAPVRPGKTSRPLKIEVGVREFSLDCSNLPSLPCDLLYDAQIKSGQLLVSLQFASKKEGERKANGKRHGSRTFTNPSPPVRQSTVNPGRRTQSEYSHPRASQICDIFNPLLAKSQQTMLEANPAALKAACEAIGDFAINDLLEFLGKGRASRELSSPRHVALIIGDAKKDAAARAKLPPGATAAASPKRKRGFVEAVLEDCAEEIREYGRLL